MYFILVYYLDWFRINLGSKSQCGNFLIIKEIMITNQNYFIN